MLELSHINFGYSSPLLSDINIRFKRGNITTVIGPNGCGKSTLLKLSAKLLKPQSGEIKFNGQNIQTFRSKEYARKAAILLQSTAIPPISVQELTEHGRFPYHSYYHHPKVNDKAIVENAMETAGVQNLRNKNLNQLSGGERQRAFIAMTLAQDTELLMLDEPTTFLDINHQLDIMNLVKKLNNQGKTIIMVLHDLNLALHNSHSVLLMNQGKIIKYGTPAQVAESGEINRIFSVKTTPVVLENKTYYVFRTKE